MFSNYININDILDLSRRIKSNPRILASIKNKIFAEHQNKIEQTWSHTDAVPDKWWFIPEVMNRWNFKITGDAKKSYTEYFVEKYLNTQNQYSALSLACGTGSREFQWINTGKLSSIDAYDLSEVRIRHASCEAEKQSLNSKLSFLVGDAAKINLRNSHYDLFLGEQSLHHFSPLEEILLKVKKSLKPQGLILINEFVGPDRFQWSDAQLYYANKLLGEMPERYRKYWNSNSIKTKIYKPGRLRMLLNDPSEAIESSRIIPLLNKQFQPVEFKECGGTILHLVFDGIAHNFLKKDEETNELLNKCFSFEDELLLSGKLKSDFIFAVYQNIGRNF